jgi:hypothetical protein
VQAAHAAITFTVEHPGLITPDITVVFLAARDELALCWLLADAERDSIHASSFSEPDLGGALTAVALRVPAHDAYGNQGRDGRAAQLCRRYPLALKGLENDHPRT